MSFVYPSICYGCARLRKGLVCAAFPNGIPDLLLFELADHRQTIEGDGGITFLLDTSEEGMIAFQYWQEYRPQ